VTIAIGMPASLNSVRSRRTAGLPGDAGPEVPFDPDDHVGDELVRVDVVPVELRDQVLGRITQVVPDEGFGELLGPHPAVLVEQLPLHLPPDRFGIDHGAVEIPEHGRQLGAVRSRGTRRRVGWGECVSGR